MALNKTLALRGSPPAATQVRRLAASWLPAVAAPDVFFKFPVILTVCLALFAQCQAEEEAGDARLGYITVGNSGATTLTFNATSIQNAIILGLFILVLGALVLPLFGVSMDGTYEEPTGYGYGYDAAEYAYDPANYQQYQKR